MIRFQKKGSFSAARETVCSVGHPHPSGLEASVCEIMLARQRSGDIRNLKWQHSLDLAFGIKWKVDWSFEQAPDWHLRFAEAKGRSDRGFALKLRMFKSVGPGPLELWKGTHQRPVLVKVMIPNKEKERDELSKLNSDGCNTLAKTLEELQRANEELKNLREWNSDLEEQNGRVAIKNQLLEGKIATLEFDLQRTRGLLEEAAPFARHVAVCENHDGSKFQELAEGWLERASRGES